MANSTITQSSLLPTLLDSICWKTLHLGHKLYYHFILLIDELLQYPLSARHRPDAAILNGDLVRMSTTSSKPTNQELKNILVKVKDRLEEVNLSNARLLYANRVLQDTSLNELQKNII